MRDPLGRLRRFGARHGYASAGVYLFCLFMTFVYCPYDVLIKPLFRGVDSAQEVWLGFMLTGWLAKLTEPLHWAIYGALGYGFHQERPWAWTAAALYTVQVAIGSAIWVVLYASYGPLGYALTPVVIGAFLVLALVLSRRRPEPHAQRVG